MFSLFICAFLDKIAIWNHLVALDVNLTDHDKNNNTALHLTDHDKNGDTALHLCCAGKSSETKISMIKLLLKANIDTEIKNAKQKRAVDLLSKYDCRLTYLSDNITPEKVMCVIIYTMICKLYDLFLK